LTQQIKLIYLIINPIDSESCSFEIYGNFTHSVLKVEMHPTYSLFLRMSIHTCEYQPRLSGYISSDFYEF